MLTGWDYVELRGTFLGLNGPEKGLITLTPTDSFESADGAYQVLPVAQQMMLDPTGSFSVPLIATDCATLRGNAWLWEVVVRTETIRTTRYLRLPKATPVVNYAIVEEP